MYKNKLIKSVASFALIITALGASSCDNEASVVTRFDLYETFKDAYSTFSTYGFDYSDWSGFDYYYYFSGQETIYTTWSGTYEPVTVEGQETTYETIQASYVDGVVNGHEELDTQHWDSYYNGGVWGSYYDGSTLYKKDKKVFSDSGEYTVSSISQDVSYTYFTEAPYTNADIILNRFIEYGEDGESLAEIGYFLSGEINQIDDVTIVSFEADYIQEDISSLYGYGLIAYDFIVSITYDKENNPVSLDYSSNTIYDYDYDYVTDFSGYYSEEVEYLHFEYCDGEISAPNWIYE